ncbi:MAG: hypothetical protein M3322_07185 [Actinomycetota bacterium]|nr:hypothetical protein [Actinomycetota bacterium]
MGRLALIVNPLASGVDDARIEAVERTLRPYAGVATYRTSARGDAVNIAREVSREVDAVVVLSGDGGFNEALNGIARDIPIGFVPGGRSNVLPRALGLPRNAVAAAEVVGRAFAARRARRISLGRANGRRFGFSAGVGLDAELVRRVEARGGTSEGARADDLAFAAVAARLVTERRGRFPPRLEIEGRGRAAFALVANCDPYTYFRRVPLHVAPRARFELGVDLVAPVCAGPRALPRFLAYALLGRGQTRAPDVLYGHDLDRVLVHCDAPTPLQLDGEDLGDVTSAAFESERGALAVLV